MRNSQFALVALSLLAPLRANGEEPVAAPDASESPPVPAFVLTPPDISAVDDLAIAFDSYDVARESPRGANDPTGRPHRVTPVFQNLELGLQSVVDRYARADVFVSLDPRGVSIDEAYLTTLMLPAGLQIRAGWLRAPFGRLNQTHAHAWSFVDTPFAQARLVAPEPLAGPGADLAWLVPVPWFAELHLDGQMTRPGVENTEQRTVAGRLFQFFQVGSAMTLGIGLSAVRVETYGDIGGADLTLKVQLAAGRPYVLMQAELLGRKRPGVRVADGEAGGWVQMTRRESASFAYGLRYERARAGQDSGAPGAEQRASLIGSWYPSESQRLRAQISYDRRPAARTGLEAMLQWEFAIGAHGAHAF